jgi:hypothetical protein
LGYIIVGILFILGGASGEFVLKGTDSGGLLVLVGFGMVGFGAYRLANPQVQCRLCLATMPKSEFRGHLRARHPAEASALSFMEEESPIAATGSVPASESFELVILDVGQRPHKVVKAIRESFSLSEAEAASALTHPLRGGYATVEGARMAVEAVGARAETRERLGRHSDSGLGAFGPLQVQKSPHSQPRLETPSRPAPQSLTSASESSPSPPPPSKEGPTMQSPAAPPVPPIPQQVVVKKQWGWAIGAIVLAVMVGLVGTLAYASVNGDLDRTRTELVSAQSELASANSELDRTEKALTKARKELRSEENLGRILSNCSVRLLGAWYQTLNFSYAVTGVALQRAVNSRVCAVPRAAYQRTH